MKSGHRSVRRPKLTSLKDQHQLTQSIFFNPSSLSDKCGEIWGYSWPGQGTLTQTPGCQHTDIFLYTTFPGPKQSPLSTSTFLEANWTGKLQGLDNTICFLSNKGTFHVLWPKRSWFRLLFSAWVVLWRAASLGVTAGTRLIQTRHYTPLLSFLSTPALRLSPCVSTI